jgi:hypothetical protein
MWKNSKNTIIIPNKFTIAGSTYNINIVPNSEKDLNGNLGDLTNIFHQIRVCKTCELDKEIKDIPEDEFIKTYLHELGHCFNYYYNNECSEEFANAFANFFYEYLISKE